MGKRMKVDEIRSLHDSHYLDEGFSQRIESLPVGNLNGEFPIVSNEAGVVKERGSATWVRKFHLQVMVGRVRVI